MKTLFALILLSFSTGAFAANEDTFDRALTRSEMQKLLPLYVAMVEKQAATLPSATENQLLGNLASFATDHIYFAFDKDSKIIGLQSHTIESITQSVESSLAELKQVTPAQRQEEAVDLLAGFKGLNKEGRISCRLGYHHGFKDEHERIVKCEDNRSQEGSGEGDDDGFYDVRRITISVNAKTLEPVSTLELWHMIAD